MSEHEIFKLKKELVTCRKLIEQQRSELKLKEARLLDMEEEADFHRNLSENLKKELEMKDAMLYEKEQIILKDDPDLKNKLQRDLRDKEEALQMEIEAYRKLKDQCEALEAQKQIYQTRLRDAALKYNDEQIISDAENFRDEVLGNRVKVQNLVEKCNQMSQALEQYSAENRVLRKMVGVPDDYQFELGDIIQEGQMQVEKYRAQVRALEEEVEELEEERARLRRRLRENQYGGDVPLEDDDVGTRHTMKAELKDLRDKCKMYQDELEHYKHDGGAQQRHNVDMNPNREMYDEVLTKQNAELKGQLGEIMRFISGQGGKEAMSADMRQATSQPRNMQGLQNFGFPPNPLPGAFGNYNDIKEGMSHRFNTKLPVDMTHLYGDSGTLDQMQVKYEIASLQLQNMETLRLLQEKEKEYLNLQNEVEEIKEDIRRRCLLVQDELFTQYVRDKTEWETKFGDLKQRYDNGQEMLAKYKIEILRHEEFLQEIEKKDPQSLMSKLADMTKRSAILDVNLIKLSRKYDSLNEEYKQIKTSFVSQQSDYIEKEKDLMQKVYTLVHWKRLSTAQMKVMLHQLQNSVPIETHNAMRQQLEYAQDKLANIQLKESDYIRKIAALESAERDLYEKSERIRGLEEELIEVQLEEEVVKKRLEALDPYFRKFQMVYQQIVDTIKIKNISPLQMFQMFDVNGDGKISKNEFGDAIGNLGINIVSEEMEVLYMFVDLDGTGEIEYQEFIRRLRRSGVNIRKKEDELLFTLYRAIQDAGLQPRTAFEIFDTNGDKIISKQDMKEVLIEMKINVSSEVIDYIFKIADTSGDDQIQYDEFINLFDGIVKNQMQEDTRMVIGELDWKMHAMLQIDAAVKEQNLTLLDAFKMIDRNEDQTVSLREFTDMFDTMKMGLPHDAIKDLFSQMDKDRNGEISYNEMLNYLREAKQEEDKLKKLKFIQERTKALRESSAFETNIADVGQNTMMTMESRLQMKIAILENREKNANQRSQTLIQQLGNQDSIIKDMAKQVNDLQRQMEKSNETFYREREENMRLKERVMSAITKEESEKLKRQNEMQKLQITDLNGALTTYRNLYDTAVTQTKIMRLTIEKIKNDHEMLQSTIKELQSSSDQNATIGKLYHHVMVSRWNEGQTNQKYEKLLDDIRRLKLEEASYETAMKEKQDELQEQTSLFRETILAYEKQVSELKVKLLPTVTLQRVEEQANRIKEIAEMKFEVEKQNRNLREQFYELQLKADYFDIYKGKLEELEQRLKSSNSDELSQQIIEVSEKYSECKIELLKTLRDLQMAREKEDYYQRLNRQYTDNIKKLEFDLSNSDLVLRKREEEWRRKFYEQRKTIFNQLGVQDGQDPKQVNSNLSGQETISKAQAFLQQRKDQQVVDGKVVIKKTDGTSKLQITENEYHSLKAQVEGLENELKKKNIEIEGLNQRLRNQTGGSQVFSQTQLDSYTKDVLQQEAEKLSMAAQQTIRTLQDIIRDKDNQVERKEQQIDQVKKEAMMHKKKDLETIRHLNEMLHQRNRDRLNEQIALPSYGAPAQQSYFEQQPPVMLQTYQAKLKEKDELCRDLEIQLEAERKAMKKLKDDLVRVLNEKEQVQGELLVEQRKNETEQYRKQIERLQKLVNTKNKELTNIKSTVTQLKEEVFKIAEETVKKEQEFNTKEGRLNSNNTEMEMKMKRTIDEVKNLKKEMKLKHEELDLVRMNEIELKAKVTDLTKQNSELKALIVQSGGRAPKGEGAVADPDDQVNLLTNKLQQSNQLQIENAQLQREVQFLKASGQGKAFFDKDGNLLNQTNSLYFKSADDILEQIRLYLASKPRINVLLELQKCEDKTKKTRNVTIEKFFEVMQMCGIKLKSKDYETLKAAVKSEKNNTVDYLAFYYRLRKWRDCESQYENEFQLSQQAFKK